MGIIGVMVPRALAPPKWTVRYVVKVPDSLIQLPPPEPDIPRPRRRQLRGEVDTRDSEIWGWRGCWLREYSIYMTDIKR